LPERNPGSLGGDLISIGIQVALAVGLPVVVAAVVGNALDQRFGTSPTILLLLVLVGLGIAAVGVFLIIRRYLELNPVRPPSEAARAAGRRWEAEIEERQRRREAGEEEEQ
jgi:F0F1-type ATP synthase assembly protein I